MTDYELEAAKRAFTKRVKPAAVRDAIKRAIDSRPFKRLPQDLEKDRGGEPSKAGP